MAEAKKRTLMEALVEALAEMPDPVKNAENPAFKRNGSPMRYADLEATLDACKPVLAAVGIAVMQMPVSDERGLGVHTVLVGHGETMDCGSFTLPLEGQTPQKAAGAITYARRYALTALFGLAQEDDDANAASATTPRADAGRTYGGQAKGTDSCASPKQIGMLLGVAKEKGYSEADVLKTAVKKYGIHEKLGELSKKQASEFIDALTKAPGKNADAEIPVSGEANLDDFTPPSDDDEEIQF